MTFEFHIRAGESLLVGVALLIAACSRPGSTAGSSALKPIDQAALQTMVDTTAQELLIPGGRTFCELRTLFLQRFLLLAAESAYSRAAKLGDCLSTRWLMKVHDSLATYHG